MEKREQYWMDDRLIHHSFGLNIEFRAEIALRLIEHFGSVAGKLDGEDTQGRSRLGLQEPKELVDRCFEIADHFVETALARGELKRARPLEEANEEAGKLEKIKQDAVWRRSKEEKLVDDVKS